MHAPKLHVAGMLLVFSTAVPAFSGISSTTTTLISSANPSIPGLMVALTATVAPSSATGTVTFMDGLNTLGVGTLINGIATINASDLFIGTHGLTAIYGGDLDDVGSTSPTLTERILRATTTTLTSSVNPSGYGEPLTLFASVTGMQLTAPARGRNLPARPTGTVTFRDGDAMLGSATLSDGSAAFAPLPFVAGPHSITATYNGDAVDFVSNGALTQQVTGCSTVTQPAVFLDSNGGQLNVPVAASPAGCGWRTASDSDWIQLSGSGSTGSGNLTVAIPPNVTGSVRTGTFQVGGQWVAVTERATAQVFADISPDMTFFDGVNLLYAKQITSGCSTVPLNYCPGQNVPRWQMAVFIVRAVFGGDDFTNSTTAYFSDVAPDDAGFPWIQKMYELGITTGCGGGKFCPGDTVTRDQMAVFLTRMRYGSAAVFDFPDAPYFKDVKPDTFGWSWIQRLRLDGVTSGCAETLYCPGDKVMRGEMAMLVMLGGFNELMPPGTAMISSISPSTIINGDNVNFTVTGVNTHFAQGVTTLAPIPGMTIGSITVNSATSLTVNLSAAVNATLQPVSVVAITGVAPGNEEAVIPNGLVIRDCI